MAKKKPNVTKILLCEDIEGLGWLGDIVEVKMGYARNYLLPQGLAKLATEGNIKAIADERDRRAEQRKSERLKLEEAVKAVEGAEAVVAAKANEQGHLFGSVSGKEIAANLREQGFAVSDDAVQLAVHIKEVGTHEVTLKFAEDLSCKVSVVVVAEGADVGSASAEPGAGEGATGSPNLGAETPTLGGEGKAEEG
ncbi:MAG: 50S ribosomal protein L9 [Planctomycetota bacterium]|jgi:large subunit ribosomal protein L9